METVLVPVLPEKPARSRKAPKAPPPLAAAKRDGAIDQVYRYGCRAPRDPHEHALALQMLGQAWLYREELRKVYNAHAQQKKETWGAELEAEHVRAFEADHARAEEAAHVYAFERDARYHASQENLNAAIRATRARRGHLLDAGTYWLIEKSMVAAASACKNKSCTMSPCKRWACTLYPIKTQDYEQTGIIGAEIQARTQFSPTYGATHFDAKRFRHLQAPAFDHRRVTLAPDGRYHRLTVRVGPLDGRPSTPVRSITWPIKLHRPLPPGAIIKQVAVQRIRVGHRYDWEALFTIGFVREERDANATGVVGIDIGWRDEGERGMRIATHNLSIDAGHVIETATDRELGTGDPSDGPGLRPNNDRSARLEETGLFLTDVRRSLEYADAVRGFRDAAFDLAKVYAKNQNLPGAAHADEWRDKSRLMRLALRTRDFGLLWWRERDRHLEDIECGVREKAIRRRREQTRAYIDALAKRCKYVVLEDMHMTEWVAEGETAERERHRSMANLSQFQADVVQRFGAARVHWAPPQNTSRMHARCGIVREETVGPEAYWTCACGERIHQDENAAEVLRKMGERWIGDGNPPRARSPRIVREKKKKEKKEPKIPKAKKAKLEAKKKTAREPLAEAAE